MRGRLTERLLSQGLLTPSMLQELRKEWSSSTKKKDQSDDEDNNLSSPFSKKPHRRPYLARKFKKF